MLLLIVSVVALVKKDKTLQLRSLSLFGMVTLFSAVLYAGGPYLKILIYGCFAITVYEVTSALKVNRIMLVGVGCATFVGSLFLIEQSSVLPISLVIISFYVFACGLFLKRNIESSPLFYSIGIVTLVSIGFSFLIQLSQVNVLIITVVILMQMSDATAYLIGRAYGSKKIAPRISPNKTLEGLYGSVIGIVLGLLLLKYFFQTIDDSIIVLFSAYFPLFFFGANIGDLCFSKIKRLYSIKDFGSLIPGHGGVMDRLDNFVFIAPLVWVLYFVLYKV